MRQAVGQRAQESELYPLVPPRKHRVERLVTDNVLRNDTGSLAVMMKLREARGVTMVMAIVPQEMARWKWRIRG